MLLFDAKKMKKCDVSYTPEFAVSLLPWWLIWDGQGALLRAWWHHGPMTIPQWS